jgi:hypothetical protein
MYGGAPKKYPPTRNELFALPGEQPQTRSSPLPRSKFPSESSVREPRVNACFAKIFDKFMMARAALLAVTGTL